MRKLIYIFLFFPAISFAQQLTLQEAINIALKKNFDIEIAANNVAISKINNNIGIAGGLPTVTGTASDQESVSNINQQLNTGNEISRNNTPTNAVNANVTGSLLLFNGYRVIATKQRLAELEKQNQQIFNSQVQNIIAAVMVQYYNVIKQQSYLTSLQQSINVSQKQLDIIEVKKEVGLANNADVFQSKIDLNTRQQDYTTQELNIKQAKAELLNVLALKPDSNIVVKDTIIVSSNINFDKVLAAARQNADVISLDNQIRINELIEKETRAQRFPSLRANAGLSYGRTQTEAGQLLLNQSYGPFVGVSLGIPIYSGGVIKRQEQIANINTRIAKVQKQKLLESNEMQLYKTFQSYTITLEQIKSQQNTFDISRQLVDLVFQKFQLGQATIIELREAQKSFDDAAYRLTTLSYAAKIAEVELKRIGNLL